MSEKKQNSKATAPTAAELAQAAEAARPKGFIEVAGRLQGDMTTEQLKHMEMLWREYQSNPREFMIYTVMTLTELARQIHTVMREVQVIAEVTLKGEIPKQEQKQMQEQTREEPTDEST